MTKNHKSKVSKRLLKSIISIEKNGNLSKLDATEQRAPRKALDLLKHLERKKKEEQESKEKNRLEKKSAANKVGGRLISMQGKGNSDSIAGSGRNTLDEKMLAIKVGKELTNKRVKRLEFHKKKLEKKRAKKTVGYDQQVENLLKEKGQVRFGERVHDIPKLTAFPKKVIKKELIQLQETDVNSKESSTVGHKKESDQETKIGRAKKLKSLPEAERKALLQERDRLIALYRNNKLINSQSLIN